MIGRIIAWQNSSFNQYLKTIAYPKYQFSVFDEFLYNFVKMMDDLIG